MTKFSGGCLCGAVRFECAAEPVFAGNCYCTDCRKIAGTGHSSNLAAPAPAIAVTGELKTYASKADSGETVTRHFCPACGTRLFTTTSGFPGLRMIAAGTLDDPEVFKPAVSVYASRAPSWDRPLDGIPAFDEMPPAG